MFASIATCQPEYIETKEHHVIGLTNFGKTTEEDCKSKCAAAGPETCTCIDFNLEHSTCWMGTTPCSTEVVPVSQVNHWKVTRPCDESGDTSDDG